MKIEGPQLEDHKDSVQVTLPSFWKKIIRGGLVFTGKHAGTALLGYALATIFTPTISNKLNIPGTEKSQTQRNAFEQRKKYLRENIDRIESRQKELNKGILPGFLKEWAERTFSEKGVSQEVSVNALRTELAKINLQEAIKDSKDFLVWIGIFTMCLWYLTEPVGSLLNNLNENQQKRALIAQINFAIQEIFKRLQFLEAKFSDSDNNGVEKFILEAEELKARLMALEAQIDELRKSE